jgi:hypothetical protein
MTTGTLKCLVAVLALAGGARSAATTPTARREASVSTSRPSEAAPRPRPRVDDGCRELPAPAPVAPASLATCS